MDLGLNKSLGKEYFETISNLAQELGLSALGVTNAEPFVETRTEIERRKSEDLHGAISRDTVSS